MTNNNSFSPVAIIGTACRLPGAANIDEFWSMLCEGRSALGKVPEERFHRKLFYDPKPGVLNKTYTDLAGLIEYHPYPKGRYPLPENGENEYDVVQLALCETVGDALVHAGYDPFVVRCPNTGVYIGHTRPGNLSQQFDYRLCLPESLSYLESLDSFKTAMQGKDGISVIRKMQEIFDAELARRDEKNWPVYLSSDAAMLVSRAYRFSGPSMVFNSACASSLQAVCQAVYALQLGHIDMAIAGGASYFHSDTLVLFASSRSLTKNRSCPFDADADGLVIGEGNAVLVLKRLEDAVADGDPVRAVIRGTGIASDGKGKSLWAPRKEGQMEAMNRAYSGDVPLSEVDYVEAHATSTALGDATEMEAISTVFRSIGFHRKIPVGSTKGNVGHMLEAAGVTGVLKVVLALVNKKVPPVAGLKRLNLKIPWNDIPLYAPMQLLPWDAPEGGRPRRAAVNSFGIGGLNVHLVIDEWVETQVPTTPTKAAGTIASPDINHATGSARQTYCHGSKPKFDPVAVVGYGCIFPGAITSAKFWDLLVHGGNGFGKIPKNRWNIELFREHFFPSRNDLPQFHAGIIDNYQYDWKTNKIPPKQVENASPIQFMMLDAVNEALGTTDLGRSPEQRRKTGVVVGTGFGGDFSSQMHIVLALPIFLEKLRTLLKNKGLTEQQINNVLEDYGKELHKRMPALLDETGSFTPSALASRITKTLDLMGGAVAVESSEASTGAALACCIDQLAVGMNDTMLCVSGYQELGPMVYEFCAKKSLLSQRPAGSPFDRQSYGYLPGEGCGILVMQRLETAMKEKRPVYAVLRSVGCASGGSVYVNAKSAFHRAGTDPQSSTPDFMEASFQGIPALDHQILEAYIDGMLESKRKYPLPPALLGTTLNHVGYLGMASGIPSLLKSVMALHKKTFPPVAGHHTTSPAVLRHREWVDIPTTSRQWPNDGTPRKIGLFTGKNSVYYILLEEILQEKNKNK